MPPKFIRSASVLIAASLVLSCSKNNETVPPTEGEPYLCSVVIDQGNATRSSDGQTHGAEGAEVAVNTSHGLKVYVFDYEGKLEYSSSSNPDGRLSLVEEGGKYVSSPFEITTGLKYFYVFANDGTTGGLIKAPSASWDIGRFSEQVIDIAFTGDTPSIAGASEFLLGTLWKEQVGAASGGTDTEPETVELTIGRLVSKVNLKTVNLQVASGIELLGAFSDPQYRMGTIPKKIFTAGVHEGDTPPYKTKDVLVRSAVHSTGYLTPPDDANYVQYTQSWKQPDETWYVTENTTMADPVTHNQYFGNTTYIQLETVYTPDAAEVYDPTDLSPGSLSDDTFWTVTIEDEPTDLSIANIAGKTVIVDRDPATAGSLHQDIVRMSSYPRYTDGKNYHKFPVFDEGETDEVVRNRVLRNHYYEFTVTEFLGLGSHDPDVDPSEPIPNKTTVNIKATVKDWDKVTGSTPVG